MSALDEPLTIDWSSAVVEDGELSVGITGKSSAAWREHVAGVLKRLDGRRADRIAVKKDRIKVKAVADESAEELRHLLESAVHQANVDLVEPPAEEPDDAHDEPSADGGLTELFRAFAARAAH